MPLLHDALFSARECGRTGIEGRILGLLGVLHRDMAKSSLPESLRRANDHLAKSKVMLRMSIALAAQTGRVSAQALQSLHLGETIVAQILLADAAGVGRWNAGAGAGAGAGCMALELAERVAETRCASVVQTLEAESLQNGESSQLIASRIESSSVLDTVEAETCFEQALAIAQEHDIHERSYIQTTTLLLGAVLAFHAGEEDKAVQLVQQFLTITVEEGRHHCAQCGQARGEEAQMLTCGGCGVARFCNAQHQKRAWKDGSLLQHKWLCPLLCKWKLVVKSKNDKKVAKLSPHDCRHDIIAFLRRSQNAYTNIQALSPNAKPTRIGPNI